MRLSDNSISKRILLWGGMMLAGLLTLVVTMFATRGQSFLDLTYSKSTDTFYDFTYSIVSARSREEYKGMYPPLAQLFFYVLAWWLPESYEGMGLYELINSPLGAMYTLLFLMLVAILLSWIFESFLRAPRWVSRLCAMALILSAPFIYGWQRGNILFLCLPLTFVFTVYYDSDKPWLRWAANICLALAAGIKLYPAVMGMLLVKEKRWKQAWICVGLGLAALILPSLVFGGPQILILVAGRLVLTSSKYDTRGVGHQAGFQNFIDILNEGLGLALNSPLCLALLIVFMIAVFFLAKRKWQQLTILCAAMVLWPGLSFIYTMVFMAIPLLFFLNSEEEFKSIDIWYCILFAAMFVVIPFGGQNAFAFTRGQYYMLNISTLVENIGINLLVLTVGIQVLTERYGSVIRRKLTKSK